MKATLFKNKYINRKICFNWDWVNNVDPSLLDVCKLIIKHFQKQRKKKSTRPHLDGVDKRHESQAAEVNIQGVAQRPD